MPGIPPGDYTLRVVARNPPRGERKVIRNRLWMHGDDVYCITSLVNRGWRVDGNTFTVEFASTGIATGFDCVLDRLHSRNCELDLCVCASVPLHIVYRYTYTACTYAVKKMSIYIQG